MFEQTLAPFITHKHNIGYDVIVGYTDDPNVGNTNTSIKAYLQNLYHNPPSGYNPPQYVLLVGDVEQIPPWPSQNSEPIVRNHITDLYYFSYDDNIIPDVFYGRFSARNVSELLPQIEKTLEYEQYTMPDPTYLYNAVFISGYDFTFWLEHNYIIDYPINQYFNSTNGINAYAYYQHEPTDGHYTENIISNINNGAGFVYYTGHGDPYDWANPGFSITYIDGLTNNHKYGLWIANACETNRFEYGQCFGEAALRAQNKGAVGYIGATDVTGDPTDMFWADGYKDIYNLIYDPLHLGMFDCLFDAVPSQRYSRQGQLIFSGNLAVEDRGGPRFWIDYYWEVYHLLGDPSLNIRFVPSVNCNENITITENLSAGLYEYLAGNSVTASNTISNNAVVHYGANNLITLAEGFDLKLGSIFTIDNIGCHNNGNLKSSALESKISTVSNVLNYYTDQFTSFNNSCNESIVNVYPNPALNGKFSIEILSNNEFPQSIVIYNSLGNILYQNCNSDKTYLVNELNYKGIILIKINFIDKFVVKKLIIE
jgi:hypothetical protein